MSGNPFIKKNSHSSCCITFFATKTQKHKVSQSSFSVSWLLRALVAIFFTFPSLTFSQNNIEAESEYYLSKTDKGYVLHGIILNGDTMPWVWLPAVTVATEMPLATRRRYAAWTRIKYNVKIVYPYAILAAAKLKEYDLILAKMPNEKVRSTYLKICEKELQKEFSAELKDLSINQGRILMKLIDRETGKTTYTIVKEMRGNFTVFMWQSLAVLFGSTMKQEYDPTDGDDKLIEIAIRQVEAGEI